MKVAFQGEPGAYSEQAVFDYFGTVETWPCESFDVVFESVVSAACDYGLIPIENSLAGSIHQNYDLLLTHRVHIVGEVYLKVMPKRPDETEWFVDDIVGGAIPGNFLPAIEKGLVEGMVSGAVADGGAAMP